MGPISENTTGVYQHAMSNLQRELRRPTVQRSVFSFAHSSPSELVRAKLSTTEMQHRALTYIPDDLLWSVPENENSFSLFQGFQATLPEESEESEHRKKNRRHGAKGAKLLEEAKEEEESRSPALQKLKKHRDRVDHRHEMLGVRKNMCSSEIMEIDKKIANLNSMRKIVLQRLSDLEGDELKLEQEITELDHKVEDMQDLLDEEAVISAKVVTPPTEAGDDEGGTQTPKGEAEDDGFMSASIYEKITAPSPKPKRHKLTKRKSMPIRHEHFEPGSSIREIPAHNDMITAMDFDAPFGTMVTAALDDTVRVWDLNQGRCLGLLEGHKASVRCLQVEENIVATGSIDASIRLWDLGNIDYTGNTAMSNVDKIEAGEAEDGDTEPEPGADTTEAPSASSTTDCPISVLEAHVAEVTALHFYKDTLVSGSADKTLRQWDLVKGRCVQTLDVLWAAAKAAATIGSTEPKETGQWWNTSRAPDANADFVGALQCFDAALACGTADGMVRLWDLRSGQVSRSLVGHTGPVTCLQFDDAQLVTGSLDRSIRVSSIDVRNRDNG